VAELGEDFFFDVAEAVGVSEQESAGGGYESGKNQAGAFGSDATGLHAPFEDGESDDEQRKDAVKKDFWILERDPETVGAEGPSLGIAS